MADRLTSIKNINRNTKNWTAKVKVLEKWSPRSAQRSPVKYQKLLLADAEGSKVQAMIYNENIQKLEDTLQIYLQLLYESTLLRCLTNLEIQRHKRSLSLIKRRTFWDDFITREGAQLLENTDPYPLLIGIHIKVTKYNGFSLSSRAGSSFVINPDTIAAHTLKTWCIANKEKVEQLCDQFLAKPIIQIVPEPQDKDITPITEVPKTPETLTTAEKPSVETRKLYLIASSAIAKKLWQNQE